jgi:hypothetical protein
MPQRICQECKSNIESFHDQITKAKELNQIWIKLIHKKEDQEFFEGLFDTFDVSPILFRKNLNLLKNSPFYRTSELAYMTFWTPRLF